jgi:capsid protein
MPIVLFVYCIGLSAGSLILSSLTYVFGQEQYKPIARIAVFTAILLIFAALVFIAVDLGRPEKFWVAPYGNMGQVDQAAAKAIPAEDVAWIALLDRPSQTRGMPACQASFPMLFRISDVCDSEALAWQILARVALRLYHEDMGTGVEGMGVLDPSTGGEDASVTGEVAVRVHEFDSALIFHALTPGDRIEGVERNIPGQN